MRKNIIFSALLAMAAIGLASCSSDNAPVASPDEALTPIRISAAYSGGAPATRTTYAEDGNNITATWDSGDQLYVCYNGHVNTLTLTDGAGTTTATFTGTIQGTPNSNSILICYVRDANNPSAVTVNNNGEYTYASGTFLGQDGTLAEAAKCNLYYGTTTYGTGENISCTFSVNTSMLKFTVYAPDGVAAGTTGATLTYTSDGIELAKATFTVGTGGRNIIYMTVPAGQYTGEQQLVYKSGTTTESMTLSATKANFIAGQTYSKKINMSSFTGIDLNELGYANCYIVSAGGTEYRFDATVKGNGGIDPMTGTTATAITGIEGVRVLWEEYAQGRAIEYKDNAYTVRTDGSHVYFSTPATFQEGNACIAVVDASDKILWSWHIWATPEPGTVEKNGKTFMDRNLGGIDVDNYIRGFRYQWGRKDPFPGNLNTKDNNIIYTYVPATSEVFSTVSGRYMSLAETVATPTVKGNNTRESELKSWLSAEEYNKAPWRDDVKTIYDPCPVGWRVPTSANQQGLSTIDYGGYSEEYDHFRGGSYYYTTTKTEYPYTHCNGTSGEDNTFGTNSGYAIRPVRE